MKLSELKKQIEDYIAGNGDVAVGVLERECHGTQVLRDPDFRVEDTGTFYLVKL